MNKHNDNKSSRSRWKDDNRHPKLYDERTDMPGNALQQSQQPNGRKIIVKSREVGASGSNSNAKVCDVLLDIASSKSATSQLNQNLPEDLRISKLLRRLETEQTTTGIIDLCEKLKVSMMDQANAGYIRRSFDILANSIIAVMKDNSQEALPHLTDVFAMMGYVINYDFQVYKSWICKTYKSTKLLRVPMMNSLEKTLRLDINVLCLNEQIARLMDLL